LAGLAHLLIWVLVPTSKRLFGNGLTRFPGFGNFGKFAQVMAFVLVLENLEFRLDQEQIEFGRSADNVRRSLCFPQDSDDTFFVSIRR